MKTLLRSSLLGLLVLGAYAGVSLSQQQVSSKTSASFGVQNWPSCAGCSSKPTTTTTTSPQ